MKFTGDKLRKTLKSMDDSNQKPFTPKAAVILVTREGKYTTISPAHALQFIEDWGLTGHGKNGLIKTVIADGAPRLSPFAPLGTKRMFAAEARENAPRVKSATRHKQRAGAKLWKHQQMAADSGTTGQHSNIHLPLALETIGFELLETQRRLVE
jgi:hypothetical protein